MDYREEFLQIWHQHVSRPGSEKAAGLAGQQDGFLLGSGLHPVPRGL